MSEQTMDREAFEELVRGWLDATAPREEPSELLDRVLATTVVTRRWPGWWRVPPLAVRVARSGAVVGAASLALAALVLLGVVLVIGAGSRPYVPLPPGRNGLLLASVQGEARFLDAGGRVVRRLSTGEYPGFGAWTADGERFVRMTGTADAPVAVVTDPAQSELARIDLPRGAFPDFTWSPDGRRFAFTVSTETLEAIFVVDARTGAAPVAITEDLLHAVAPSWSPDGAWIAFRGGVALDAEALHVVRPDGTDERRVSDEARAVVPYCGFSWSPDARSVLFSTAYNGVWLVDVDGRNERLVIGNAIQAFCAAMSPDGQRAAAVVSEETGKFVEVIWLSDRARITPPGPLFDDGIIVWSPDGRSIAMNGRTLDGGPKPRALLDATSLTAGTVFHLDDDAGITAWQRLPPTSP
jgi:Tol biopolymer transport system component